MNIVRFLNKLANILDKKSHETVQSYSSIFKCKIKSTIFNNLNIFLNKICKTKLRKTTVNVNKFNENQ